MKPVRDWDENYILSLPVQEYDDIEFKAPQWLDISTPAARDKTCTELARELSALANTGGGQLVLGIKDPQKCKSGVLEIADGGVPVILEKKDTAEWLRAVIPTLLEFPITGFEVHPILPNHSNSRIEAGKALFVIDVPDSEAAPHQSKRDNKYYMRIGGNSVPVGHRLVLDILGRQKYPDVILSFQIVGEFVDEVGRTIDRPRRRKFFIRVIAKNSGRVLAHYVNVILSFPPTLVPNVDIWVAKQEVENGETICKENLANTRRDIISGEEPYAQRGPSWFDPILPQRHHSWTLPLNQRFAHTNWNEESIRWEIFADNASGKIGTILVKDIVQITEWNQDSCPCCGAEEIARHQWNCDCDCKLLPRGTPFLCPHCGCCTGLHCRCGR